MTDLIERLRKMAEADYYGHDQPHFVSPEECADEIERLRDQVALDGELGAEIERLDDEIERLRGEMETMRIDCERELREAYADYRGAAEVQDAEIERLREENAWMRDNGKPLLDEIERLRSALKQIAFLRPFGATPKLIKGELVEQIERIALDAIESGP